MTGPGCAFTHSMNSGKVFAGFLALTASTHGMSASWETMARSFCGSIGNCMSKAGSRAAVVVISSRLLPSALLLAMLTMPTIVPPPGLFSTTIVLPVPLAICSARTRAEVSVEPPGP